MNTRFYEYYMLGMGLNMSGVSVSCSAKPIPVHSGDWVSIPRKVSQRRGASRLKMATTKTEATKTTKPVSRPDYLSKTNKKA